MSDLKFTKDHEWLLISGSQATVGITEFAQEQLGDVVFVELPEVGSEYSQGDEVAVIESVKAAGEIVAPLAGKVVEVNEELADNPELVNESPLQDGWFVKMELNDGVDLSELMSESEYQEFTAE
ncbi:glycine cleavage system protein GcvH [Pseudoteredinibacter isoporae]|uniref:Glycine cleavage system H protein n=2 Tax=Pseudoteredinibacter isoporae TaxID=570281 RepID=A0A7X0JUS7_9GAMM|nr:glycine cleavage system protein GcvH [Pseudoteredinibacter isoporae]MBB6521706.1 glycine cleavage system H protein [Pseudoteredinibacter isoporae]NHO87254.1 glycine cleavage system protein GcvH [Pseudoteredinibacter isoporae]NIB23114.1 glycine cleavage system protein GcvH [Pseudoteredinibacter isoporae]